MSMDFSRVYVAVTYQARPFFNPSTRSPFFSHGISPILRPPQSRPQSPRYPCPAERENEDLWEDAFELGISLAIDRACAVPPEVDKQ